MCMLIAFFLPFLSMTQVDLTKFLKFLLLEHDFCYTDIDYASLSLSEVVRNGKGPVHGIQTVLIHV